MREPFNPHTWQADMKTTSQFVRRKGYLMRIHTRLLLPTLGGLAALALLLGWQGQSSIRGLAGRQQDELFQARRLRMDYLLADLSATALKEASLFSRLPQV